MWEPEPGESCPVGASQVIPQNQEAHSLVLQSCFFVVFPLPSPETLTVTPVEEKKKMT